MIYAFGEENYKLFKCYTTRGGVNTSGRIKKRENIGAFNNRVPKNDFINFMFWSRVLCSQINKQLLDVPIKKGSEIGLVKSAKKQ